MSIKAIKLRDMAGEGLGGLDRVVQRVRRVGQRFQFRVTGDAETVARTDEHLGTFMLLVTDRAGDFRVSRKLVGVMFGDSVAEFALLIVDRMLVVAERDQALQRRPSGVAFLAVVLDQSMRRADRSGLIDRTLAPHVLPRDPQQRADSG